MVYKNPYYFLETRSFLTMMFDTSFVFSTGFSVCYYSIGILYRNIKPTLYTLQIDTYLELGPGFESL